MTQRVLAAVDIGASGGRVMAGVVAEGRLDLVEIHRFPNGAREQDGHLRWDLTALYEQVLIGLAALAERFPQAESIGIDTWAVDYGCLDAGGDLLAAPIAYRDGRTAAVIEEVHARVAPADLYAVNGLQFLPFNTIYQLAAEQRGPLWSQIAHLVLLPDLLGYWLTGELRTEITNASTTGLLDATTRTWSTGLLDALEIDPALLPALIEPGEIVGTIHREVAERTGLPATTRLVAVGSHDTASAVVGVPAQGRDFAYVSSGTWSLVGLELDGPILSDAARVANFTNEGGVDGRVRFLRNVGGLWLLQESLRTWRESGAEQSLDPLLTAAAELPPGGPTIDVDSAEFIAPGDMPERIAAACRTGGRAVPTTPAATVRCILDSLAHAYARTIEQAAELTGSTPAVIHVVGGGSRNELLCRLTAELSGLPVLAGPVEGTALGNLLIQARTAGALSGGLDDLRAVLRAQVEPRVHSPRRTVGP